jgi:hypothetical protein
LANRDQLMATVQYVDTGNPSATSYIYDLEAAATLDGGQLLVNPNLERAIWRAQWHFTLPPKGHGHKPCKDFKQHRHDQTLSSLVGYQHKVCVIPDETARGTRDYTLSPILASRTRT